MDRALVYNHSHWGAFSAVVKDGRVVGATPFRLDPDPSPLIDAIPDAVHAVTRVACPMIREGWLQRGRAGAAGRGREAFVAVGWERGLDLVASEISRVRREHGPAAIMGGSQGWSSAGLFHEARGQLRRFLAAGGGFAIIVHEPWWTATARHADIVLPATTTLEPNDIGCSPRDQFVIAMHQAINPVGEARNDFDILSRLARRLVCEDAFVEGRSESAWLRHIYGLFCERAHSNLVPEFQPFWEKGWVEIAGPATSMCCLRIFAPTRSTSCTHRRARL